MVAGITGRANGSEKYLELAISGLKETLKLNYSNPGTFHDSLATQYFWRGYPGNNL
jgi:hypothetical protein